MAKPHRMETILESQATSHTPGPWKIDGGVGPNDERYVWTDSHEPTGTIGSHEVCVAVVKGKRFNEGQDCTREEILAADARLIALTPDFFAVCKALVAWNDSASENGIELEKICRAAKKAVTKFHGKRV